MEETHQRTEYETIVRNDPSFRKEFAFKSYPYPISSVWGSIIDNLIDYCVERNIDPVELENHLLDNARNFMDDVFWGFNPDWWPSISDSERDSDESKKEKIDGCLWRHQDVRHFATKKIDVYDTPKFDELDLAVRTYLKVPWLRNVWLDWAFIDAYIWCEMVAFREHIFMFRADGASRGIFGRGDPEKYLFGQLKFRLLGVLFRYALPLGILFFFWKDASSPLNKALLWGTGIYGMYLAYRLVMAPLRIFSMRKRNKVELKRADLLGEMVMVYETLIPPASVQNLRNSVYRARDNGAVFRPGLFSILDDLRDRQQTILDPSP